MASKPCWPVVSFERAASFCEFSKGGMFQSIIHHIKYSHREKLGIAMGRLLGDLWGVISFVRLM